MPEPRPHELAAVPPMWPASLLNPQTDSIIVTGPGRTDPEAVLTGHTRLRVRARTATMQYAFTCWLTQAQMQDFETWYRIVARDFNGEFYAPWIGGSRVVAFVKPYQFTALGAGYALHGRLIRTRIDTRVCDAFISEVFGGILRDDGISSEIVLCDLAALDRYVDDFPLALIVANEC